MRSCVTCKYNNGVAVVGNKDEPCYSCLTDRVNSLPNYEMKEELEDWKPPKITNADRIRAMTDEELTDFLLHICDWRWREWLKEEVSE